MPQNTANVVGNDLIAPVQYQDGLWRTWNFDQIFFGLVGAGKFVPNVVDEVHHIQGATVTVFIVDSVHPTTLIPTLRPANVDENDAIPQFKNDTFRVFIDKSVNPYRLSVDSRLTKGGSQLVAAKLFRGVNTSNDGVVVSAIFNQNGEVVSENIPLELVSSDTLTNHSLKLVAACHTAFDLIDGEMLTCVFYDNVGFVASIELCIVENTSFIRSTDASRKYVTSIALETPFMSSANNRVIQYPMNIPLNAMNLIGVVNYSDGSVRKHAVDGSRFLVHGLEAYAPTITSQKTPIVLKYLFANNEYGLGVHIGDERFTTEQYQLAAGPIDGNYALQLYSYPIWVDSVSGYRLEWFMYELDRGIHYPVTDAIRIETSYSVWNPKLYGTKQTLKVKINLKDVNGSYKNFYHVQMVDIQLNRPGNERPSYDHVPNWQVSCVAGQVPTFGALAYATYERITTNEWLLKIGGGHLLFVDWLAAYYEPTRPLYNTYTESHAPAPTHFKLIAGNNVVEYPIEQWNSSITLNSILTNNSTIFLEFFNRTVDTDLHLSVAGLPIWQTDNVGDYI